MKTFKSFSEASTKDITKYSSKDLGVAFSKFLFTNEDDGKATYMTITGYICSMRIIQSLVHGLSCLFHFCLKWILHRVIKRHCLG